MFYPPTKRSFIRIIEAIGRAGNDQNIATIADQRAYRAAWVVRIGKITPPA